MARTHNLKILLLAGATLALSPAAVAQVSVGASGGFGGNASASKESSQTAAGGGGSVSAQAGSTNASISGGGSANGNASNQGASGNSGGGLGGKGLRRDWIHRFVPEFIHASYPRWSEHGTRSSERGVQSSSFLRLVLPSDFSVFHSAFRVPHSAFQSRRGGKDGV